MAKQFWKNPRPLVFALAAMVLLCGVLLFLYYLARQENTLLKTARSEQFLSLAAGEAEAAVAAWQNDSPTAEIYHRILSAAEYLTMTAPTEQNRELIRHLREAGAVLLQGDGLSAESVSTLQTLAGGGNDPAVSTGGAAEEKTTRAETASVWKELPVISRREGLKSAETMTQTKNTLHPAAGRYFIYTCRNVYVKLSQHGGVPLEIAVYTPVQYPASYDRENCRFRSARFLETVLPRFSAAKEPLSAAEEGYLCRFLYPFADGQVRVDVRTDTGRITGLQMLAESEKEQPLPAEKDCSYIQVRTD